MKTRHEVEADTTCPFLRGHSHAAPIVTMGKRVRVPRQTYLMRRPWPLDSVAGASAEHGRACVYREEEQAPALDALR